MKIGPAIILLGLALAGCGPDAPRDNPYDVPQTGVYGTTYRRSGGILSGVTVSVSPANKTTVSDGQGNYAIDLPGGSRQTLQFTAAERQNETMTIDVPERGLLQQNVIMRGQIGVDTFKVKTIVIQPESSATRYYIQPYLVAHHPDGRSYLDSFTYRCRIDTFNRASDAPARRNDFTNVYIWIMIEAYVAGYEAEFQVNSPSNSWLGYRDVPPFLEPPGSLDPSGYETFVPPDTLRWVNPQSNVNITVEVWQGTGRVWLKDTTNISKVYLPVALQADHDYWWRVISRDINDNRSLAEATFHTGP
ncbi:MAG: hypothetical protein QME74_10195, partial [Candidatus Edwardsbacteria bacterium]|nr:hypothetical protein [Candidatus Edwardsbacteria bacterium]